MTSTTDLSTVVGSVPFPFPVFTASGTSGHGAELEAFFDLSSIGAVVVKSLCAEPWPGNRAPRVSPLRSGMLNSVGLQGPGIDAFIEHELPALAASGARVIMSIWGRRIEEYERAAAEMCKELSECVVAIEVNISCPNVEDHSKMFSHSPSATEQAIGACTGAGLPLWAKLSPNVSDITEIADAAYRGGAEAVVLTNTLFGLAIDVESRRTSLGAGGGGLSGDPLHSVVVRAVYECARAFPTRPIVGVGGVSRGVDAVEFLMAGASAVEVGTATLADPKAPLRVLDELSGWCARHGVARVADLVGAVHR